MGWNYVYVHLIVVFLSTILITKGFALTHSLEVSALQDLYRALNSTPLLHGWNGSNPCEESWTGVVCCGSSVIHLKIQGLNLTGHLGGLLNNLQNLKQLDVSSNNIVGEIPFGLPPNATHMNLSHNFLNGPIGNVFTGLGNLKEMDLSYNNFTGDLPSSFGSLTNLTRLFLQNNTFTGSVIYLAKLPLTDLNIQDNMFSGILPHHFQSIPNLWIGGNKFYAVDNSPPRTFPLDSKPVEQNISRPPTTQANTIKNHAPPKASEYKEKHVGSGSIAFMVGGGTLMATTGVALLIAIRLNRLRAQKLKSLESNQSSLHSYPTSPTIEVSSTALDESLQIPPFNSGSLLSPRQSPSLHHNKTEESSRRSFSKRGRLTGRKRVKVYAVAELRLATNSFSEVNLLGQGSLGPVYRAEFPDGKILAVKKINMAGLSFSEEEKFLDVVRTASRLKHPNIVALNGYCLEQGKHLLVYDYVRNLTLNDALHSDAYNKSLSWALRLRIALGVAQALDYLHSMFSPPVAHGNLKSANVLLDENLMPHVCDCGLAILSPLTSNQTKIPAIEITIGETGYIAPDDSHNSGITSRTSDVFAFGVLLLELLTGKKPFDSSMPREEQFLAKWASSRLHDSESLEQMVDPGIKKTFSFKSLSHFADMISLCLQPVKEFRPPMSQVVDSLISFAQKFNMAKSSRADGAELDSFEKSFRSTTTRFMGSPALSHGSA